MRLSFGRGHPIAITASRRRGTAQRRLDASAWRVPSVYAVLALSAGAILPRLELLLPGRDSTVDVEVAIAMYSSIASGMIALTGLVFSMTFVMVQFSATAYSPRLALWLARDPLLSHAIGIFIATFLYALAALSWVNRRVPGVPVVTVVVVVALLLASIAAFVLLLRRIALLQVNRLLTLAADHGREVIASVYPPFDPTEASTSPALSNAGPVQLVEYRGRPLTVQSIDAARLLEVAEQYEAVIAVAAAVGDTLVESMPVLYVMQARTPIDRALLMEAIELGNERTFEQDPTFALRILVDVAVKALSPAVNDPTTAVQALDQIGDLLIRVGQRHLDVGVHQDTRRQTRVVIPVPTWEDFLRLAFNEIGCYGATSVQVMRRLNALMADLIPLIPVQRRAAVGHWQTRIASSIATHFIDDNERVDASARDRLGLGIDRDRPFA
jgi:uncharacterized membrane protein